MIAFVTVTFPALSCHDAVMYLWSLLILTHAFHTHHFSLSLEMGSSLNCSSCFLDPPPPPDLELGHGIESLTWVIKVEVVGCDSAEGPGELASWLGAGLFSASSSRCEQRVLDVGAPQEGCRLPAEFQTVHMGVTPFPLIPMKPPSSLSLWPGVSQRGTFFLFN